mmetsp:Transcript_41080/g.97965  ORF Transcript_41080/g.97965 Transcript_41080/m.97965 type:complete len:334 (-) Transcript_41080:960-1961(-)
MINTLGLIVAPHARKSGLERAVHACDLQLLCHSHPLQINVALAVRLLLGNDCGSILIILKGYVQGRVQGAPCKGLHQKPLKSQPNLRHVRLGRLDLLQRLSQTSTLQSRLQLQSENLLLVILHVLRRLRGCQSLLKAAIICGSGQNIRKPVAEHLHVGSPCSLHVLLFSLNCFAVLPSSLPGLDADGSSFLLLLKQVLFQLAGTGRDDQRASQALHHIQQTPVYRWACRGLHRTAGCDNCRGNHRVQRMACRIPAVLRVHWGRVSADLARQSLIHRHAHLHEPLGAHQLSDALHKQVQRLLLRDVQLVSAGDLHEVGHPITRLADGTLLDQPS